MREAETLSLIFSPAVSRSAQARSAALKPLFLNSYLCIMIIAIAWQLQVPVTPWNVSELRDYVINGPAIHPGQYDTTHTSLKGIGYLGLGRYFFANLPYVDALVCHESYQSFSFGIFWL